MPRPASRSSRIRALFTLALLATVATVSAATVPATAPAKARSAVPAPPLDADVLFTPNIHYGPDPLQVLDVYAPKTAHNTPILLYVHGGEWSRGDKNPVAYKPNFFTSHGIIFIAMDYRLAPKDPHPAQVDDIATAVRWTVDHIANEGGDPHKIILLGHSAGTHMVTYVALNPAPLATVGLKPSDLLGVIAWSGDMYDLNAGSAASTSYRPFISQTFGDDPAALTAASPNHYLAHAPAAPPMLVAVVDDARGDFSRTTSKTFVDAVNKAGGHAQLITLKNRSHGLANTLLGAPGDPTADQVMAFINHILKKAK